MVRTARIMYGLPVTMEGETSMPLGYDSFKVVHGEKLCWPNDEAFKLLVKAKYLMLQSSTRKVAAWLDKELHNIGYDFSTLRNYRETSGLSHTAINQILKYRPPFDECLLGLDERERIFRVEAESAIPGLLSDGGVGG